MKPEIVFIASNNSGKIIEIKELLDAVFIKSFSLRDLSSNVAEPEENGYSFQQNSLIKAKYYSSIVNEISLADDSGLCVYSLDNYPGIYSARIAGKNKDFKIAFSKIAKKLQEKNITTSPIKAFFICSLTIFNPTNSKFKSFEGRVEGKLTFPAIGNNGFGYDPIFIPHGHKVTFAQMSQKDKDKISHRSIAFKKFEDWLNQGGLKNIY